MRTVEMSAPSAQRRARPRARVRVTPFALLVALQLAAAPAHASLLDPVIGPDPAIDSGAMSSITRIVGAQSLWERGITGRGVDVALIDTGVTSVAGIPSAQIVHGADLSFDSQSDAPRIDTYGHGTHLAGIIAGRDAGVTASANGCMTCLNGSGFSDTTKFVGVAPEARVLSVKIGADDGSVDVSQMIAAIDWVVEHRRDNGMNIRVLNLSFGTDSAQSYTLDPLAYAAEVAWRKGIFVVVASGNDGTSTQTLATPANSPYVFAVGASDPNGTLGTSDDTVPAWAQRGTNARSVNVVAPGVHVASLDVPDSYIKSNEGAVPQGRFMRGSGTSQAAAVVSGVAALLFQKYPTATPDQIKDRLQKTAHPLGLVPPLFAGYGIVDANAAASALVLPSVLEPSPARSTGLGSLEASRGTGHVEYDGAQLTGEKDIFGRTWKPSTWAAASLKETSWVGSKWNGAVWSGSAWSGGAWGLVTWTAKMWTGTAWSGHRWSSTSWSGHRWSGHRWSGHRWSGIAWG